jgi:ABC-type multidrug transport system fused ATPase/permease subunit
MCEVRLARRTGPSHALLRLEAEFIRPHRRAILAGLIVVLLGALLLLPVPLLQGWALDQLVSGGESASQRSAILLALGFSVVCYVGRLGLVWRGHSIMTRVSLEVVRDLTDAMHRKYQRLPLVWFDREETGQLIARITSDVGSLLIFLGAGSLQLASDLILAAGIAVLLLYLRWELALVCFLVVPLYALAPRLFSRRLDHLARQVRNRIGAIYALLSERISAVRVVRSFAQEEAELLRLDGEMKAHLDLSRASLRTAAAQSSLAGLLGGVGTATVLVTGVILIRSERLSVGNLLALSALAAQLYNPLVRLIQFHGGAAATRVAIDRMMEVLEEPEALTDQPGALPLSEPRGQLVFEKVSFRYGPDAPTAVRDISLTVEPGTTVGVLGPSGSGKSTLLALAPRLYDVADGRVSLDGRDVRQLRLADLRRTVVLVPQQAVLFEGTLRSNLTYASSDVSGEVIRRALEALDLARLVDSLPLGLDTPVGERGLTLSGGQRQRLALARAVLAKPVVLLLDDCTSALDSETEERVCAALEELLPDCTRIIVSHKPSTVARADWLVVLEEGRIARQGPVEDILPPLVGEKESLASVVAS